jgi:hypothetical protein
MAASSLQAVVVTTFQHHGLDAATLQGRGGGQTPRSRPHHHRGRHGRQDAGMLLGPRPRQSPAKARRQAEYRRGEPSKPGSTATGPRSGQAGQALVLCLPRKLRLAGLGNRLPKRWRQVLVTSRWGWAVRPCVLARRTSGSRGSNGRTSRQGCCRRRFGRWMRMRCIGQLLSHSRCSGARVNAEPAVVVELASASTVGADGAVVVTRRCTSKVESSAAGRGTKVPPDPHVRARGCRRDRRWAPR